MFAWVNLCLSFQEEEDRTFGSVSVGIGSISSLDVPDEMPEARARLACEVGRGCHERMGHTLMSLD